MIQKYSQFINESMKTVSSDKFSMKDFIFHPEIFNMLYYKLIENDTGPNQKKNRIVITIFVPINNMTFNVHFYYNGAVDLKIQQSTSSTNTTLDHINSIEKAIEKIKSFCMGLNTKKYNEYLEKPKISFKNEGIAYSIKYCIYYDDVDLLKELLNKDNYKDLSKDWVSKYSSYNVTNLGTVSIRFNSFKCFKYIMEISDYNSIISNELYSEEFKKLFKFKYGNKKENIEFLTKFINRNIDIGLQYKEFIPKEVKDNLIHVFKSDEYGLF